MKYYFWKIIQSIIIWDFFSSNAPIFLRTGYFSIGRAKEEWVIEFSEFEKLLVFTFSLEFQLNQTCIVFLLKCYCYISFQDSFFNFFLSCNLSLILLELIFHQFYSCSLLYFRFLFHDFLLASCEYCVLVYWPIDSDI